MNREIKFRAWDSSTNEMLELGSNLWAITIDDNCLGAEKNLAELPLMQYTGLKDKNGKEIYEGDILHCGDRVVKVEWHAGCGQWDSKFIKYNGELTSNGISSVAWVHRAEVIGNIYENPELLEP